jgi:hypothetical protein
MSEIRYWFCPACSNAFGHQLSALKNNGTIGVCAGCGISAVCHKCSHASHVAPPVWIPILDTAIGAVCKECGVIIRVGRQVKALPGTPPIIKSVADIAIMAAWTVGIGALIKVILQVLRE